MSREDEMVELGHETHEIIADCRRYLTEFGSVEPELLVRRIDAWRERIAEAAARAAEDDGDTLQ